MGSLEGSLTGLALRPPKRRSCLATAGISDVLGGAAGGLGFRALRSGVRSVPRSLMGRAVMELVCGCWEHSRLSSEAAVGTKCCGQGEKQGEGRAERTGRGQACRGSDGKQSGRSRSILPPPALGPLAPAVGKAQ